jgi:hypothetical protein
VRCDVEVDQFRPAVFFCGLGTAARYRTAQLALVGGGRYRTVPRYSGIWYSTYCMYVQVPRRGV